MRPFASLGIVRVLLSSVLLAGIFNCAGHADEQGRESISEDELGLHRPANMFKLLDNKIPPICEPLFASLNTSIKIVPKPRPFPLLRNKFIIDVWREQEYRYRSELTSEIKTGRFEAAVLDFDGDGSPDGLFRDRSSVRGNEYNNVWFAGSVPDRVIKGQILDQQTVVGLLNEKNNIPKYGHWEHYVEVVRITGKPYVIVADAGYWSLEDRPRWPEIQLVQRVSDRWMRICRFKSLIKIVRRF